MTDTIKHTPTPWAVQDLKTPPLITEEGAMIVTAMAATSRRVALLTTRHYTPHDVCLANAEFIVRAANAHDDLIVALQLIDLAPLAYGKDAQHEMQRIARAALAKAG